MLPRIGSCEQFFWAAAPTDYVPNDRELRWSGAPGGTKWQRETFGRQAELLVADGAIMLVEDNMWSLGDAPHESDPDEAIVIGGTMLAIGRSGSPEELADLTSYGTGYPGNFYFLMARDVELLARMSATAPVPADIGDPLAIAVSAWDAEGFVWWTPSAPAIALT